MQCCLSASKKFEMPAFLFLAENLQGATDVKVLKLLIKKSLRMRILQLLEKLLPARHGDARNFLAVDPPLYSSNMPVRARRPKFSPVSDAASSAMFSRALGYGSTRSGTYMPALSLDLRVSAHHLFRINATIRVPVRYGSKTTGLPDSTFESDHGTTSKKSCGGQAPTVVLNLKLGSHSLAMMCHDLASIPGTMSSRRFPQASTMSGYLSGGRRNV